MEAPPVRDSETKKPYEPPALTVLGTVHGLTESYPGGSVPDCLAINHHTLSNAPPGAC